MAVIDELIIIENGESKIVDSAENGIIDEIEVENNIYHFAKQNEVDNGVCENAVNEPLIDMQIKGNSIQNGTPTPEAPLEIQSVGDKTVNLFDVSKIQSKADKIINENGVLTVIGYGVSVGALSTLCPELKAGQTVVLSGITDGLSYINIGKLWSFGKSITITEADLNSNVFLYNKSYGGDPSTIYNIQIEEGETATDYEPYGYKVPIIKSGKNLFNNELPYIGITSTRIGSKEKLLEGLDAGQTIFLGFNSATTVGAENTNFSQANIVTAVVRVKNNKTYAIKGYVKNKICFIDENFITVKSQALVNGTATNDVNAKYMAYYTSNMAQYNSGTQSWTNDDVLRETQIEENTERTDYEAYVKPQTYKIYLNEPLRKVGV